MAVRAKLRGEVDASLRSRASQIQDLQSRMGGPFRVTAPLPPFSGEARFGGAQGGMGGGSSTRIAAGGGSDSYHRKRQEGPIRDIDRRREDVVGVGGLELGNQRGILYLLQCRY